MLTINTVWIGNELGPVHAACLRSFVRNGHDVILHAYEAPIDMPVGVRLFDASKLMKRDEIVLHKKTGSLTLAADKYRYRIQREGMGPYVDCDIFCIKPFVEQDYMLGWETGSRVNNAVLNVPQNSDFLACILEASENPYFIPSWYKTHKKVLSHLRKRIGVPRHVSTRGWGVIGPSLLTHLVKELGIEDKVSAIDIYYPMHYDQTNLLFEKDLSIQDITTKRSYGIHLYSSSIQKQRIQKGSPIYEMLNC